MFSKNTMFVMIGLMTIAFVAQQAIAQEAPPPPFLRGAPPATLKSFQDVLKKNAGKTDKEIDAAVDAWIKQQDAPVKTEFGKFKAEIAKAAAAAESAHKAALAKFSPEAKKADQQLSAVAGNPGLTAQEKGKKIEEIVKGLPEKVRKEIESAMQG